MTLTTKSALGGLLIAILGGTAGVAVIAALAGHLGQMGAWFNDFLRALGEVAWPIVAIIVLFRHRQQINDLLRRMKEFWGGAKFETEPIPRQATDSPTDPLEAAKHIATPVDPQWSPAGGLPPDLAALRTKVVMEGETFLRDTLASLTDSVVREQALVTIAAALSLVARFERVDALIWQSQINLLEHLNALAPSGDTPDVLRTRFYVTAATFAKERYEHYSFDEYMAFLRNFQLVTDAHGGNLTITEYGREYLVWRAREGRARKVVI